MTRLNFRGLSRSTVPPGWKPRLYGRQDACALGPRHDFAPAREHVGDQVADERFAAFLEGHVRAEIMRVAEQREDLLVVVTHPHELLDEALGHVVGRVLVREERHAVQFKRVFKIKFVFGHIHFRSSRRRRL